MSPRSMFDSAVVAVVIRSRFVFSKRGFEAWQSFGDLGASDQSPTSVPPASSIAQRETLCSTMYF